MDFLNQHKTNPSERVPFHLSVQIIGKLQVRRGEVILEAHHFGGPKPRQVLEILLMELGTPVSKDRLIDNLWGARPPAEAMATLESYVSVLRRHLQPGAGRLGPLRTANGGYLMDPSMVDLDLSRFTSLMNTVHASPADTAYPVIKQALALANAPLLADELRSDWAQAQRSRHSARVSAALVLAGELACAQGLPHEAIEWGQRALDLDPLNEAAWTALVLAYEQAGLHTEGLQAFERCRQILNSELGCSPGISLREAQARLLLATAQSQAGLSDVIAALLVLHRQLEGQTHPVQRSDVPSSGKGVRTAGEVLSCFLQKALATV